MELNWNFQRGGEVLEKNPFHGGVIDIFWNYTFPSARTTIVEDQSLLRYTTYNVTVGWVSTVLSM